MISADIKTKKTTRIGEYPTDVIADFFYEWIKKRATEQAVADKEKRNGTKN